MKSWALLLLIVVLLVLLYLAVISPARERAEKHRRAEIFLLDTIGVGVSQHLDAGGQLPTKWLGLSNSVDWPRVSGICEYNHLPPPEESYRVLANAMTNEATGGFCFLVASKPASWPARGIGRWALVVSPKPLPTGWPGMESTNRILRTWLPENYLTPEIRSQLANDTRN